MAKLKHSYYRNDHGHYVVELQKARGKITISEIVDHMKYEVRRYGHFAIILNLNETTFEPQGIFDEVPKGDSVELVELESYDKCPFCSKMMPDPLYCPECGLDLKAHYNENRKE